VVRSQQAFHLRALSVALLAACGSGGSATVTIAVPAASVSTTASATASSAPVQGDALEIAHGVVVDLRAHRAVRTLLTQDDVWNVADDGTRAYVHIRADQIKRKKEEVRAYDLTSGVELWSQYVGRCYAMAAGPAGAFCDSDVSGEVILLEAASGKPRSIPSPIRSQISSFESIGNKIVALSWSSSQAAFFEDSNGAAAGVLTVPTGFHVARVKDGTICGAGFDGKGGTVACFDSSPRIIWSKQLTIASGMLMADDHDALIQTGSAPPESLVVSLDDGHVVARVHALVSCLVRRADGTLDGFFRAGQAAAFVELDGRERWKGTGMVALADSARAVLVDETLVLATYGRITAGATIAAFDRRTGASLWTGALDLLPITHSAYSNEVQLRLFEGTAVMRGMESMQDYIALFEPKSGKRLYFDVRAR
jgi:outer membrane protein assembly factor BamB